MHHHYSPNTKFWSFMTAITTSQPWRSPSSRQKQLCQFVKAPKCFIYFFFLADIQSYSFWKLFPNSSKKIYMDLQFDQFDWQLLSPLSCEWRHNGAYWRLLLCTHKRGSKEHIYYWQLVKHFMSSSVSPDFSLGLFGLWIYRTRNIQRRLFQDNLFTILKIWCGPLTGSCWQCQTQKWEFRSELIVNYIWQWGGF